MSVRAATITAPAKLNPVLRVLGRRTDGYHEIETLLLRLSLVDRIALELSPEPGIRLAVDAPAGVPERYAAAVPPGEDNLCCRAARLLYERTGRPPCVNLRLTKRIPVGAGLGGGSSDAAAVLLGLNRLLGSPLEHDELVRAGARLGSDVPFFAARTSCAIARGRGEDVRPLPAPPSRPVLIVVPPFEVSAGDAYRWWSEDAGAEGPVSPGGSAAGSPGAPPIQPEDTAEWAAIRDLAINELAPAVERRHPELASARAALEVAGATIALLCGSGSCVAGVFADPETRDEAARNLAAEDRAPRGPDWRIVTTSTDGGPRHG